MKPDEIAQEAWDNPDEPWEGQQVRQFTLSELQETARVAYTEALREATRLIEAEDTQPGAHADGMNTALTVIERMQDGEA